MKVDELFRELGFKDYFENGECIASISKTINLVAVYIYKRDNITVNIKHTIQFALPDELSTYKFGSAPSDKFAPFIVFVSKSDGKKKPTYELILDNVAFDSIDDLFNEPFFKKEFGSKIRKKKLGNLF
jgi:hypothetical protein